MLAEENISIPQHTLPQNKSPISKWRWGCFTDNVRRGSIVFLIFAFPPNSPAMPIARVLVIEETVRDPRDGLTPTNIFHYSESFASSKQIEMRFLHSKH